MLSSQMRGAVLLSLVAACGGSSPSGALSGGNGSDGGTDGSTNGGDATANDSSSSDTGVASDGPSSTQDSGNTNDGASKGQDSGNVNDGAPPTPDAGDAASDAPAAPCPDVHGAYAITAVDATGCGNSLSTSAPQCVRQMTCHITLQSTVAGGANPALNGNATLQNDGSFSGAAITEGTLSRTGCTGTWNAANSTMTVDCGLTGSTQACVLALRRTGSTCN
jgi:hypothetical protein